MKNTDGNKKDTNKYDNSLYKRIKITGTKTIKVILSAVNMGTK
jgi:hypothetical protein